MEKIYPVKFLDSYTRADKGKFFGRQEEVNQLYEMVFQTNLILVYGASGTGKTSLIQCGLANRFETHDWFEINIRRGTNLNQSLLKKLEEAAGEGFDPNESPSDSDWENSLLDEDTNVDSPTLEKDANSPEGKLLDAIYKKYFRPIYLIFDQFEELYILGDKEEQSNFIATVQQLLKVKQPVTLIISVREEYLGNLYEFEKAVPQLLQKKLRVEPMNLEKVKEVIRGIAHLDHSLVTIKKGEEEKFAEAIFEKVRGDEKTLTIQLPYLQVYLDNLYLSLTGDKTRSTAIELTLRELKKAEGMADVLRRFLENQVKGVHNRLKEKFKTELSIEDLWKILSPLVSQDGTKVPISPKMMVRRLNQVKLQMKTNGLADREKLILVKELLHQLTERRILRKSENEDIYEISHDSLAKRIFEKRDADETYRANLKSLIESEAKMERDKWELFSETRLNAMEPFLEFLDLSENGKELIQQSKDHWEKLRLQKLEKEEKLQQRRLRRVKGLAALGVLLVALIGFYFYQDIVDKKRSTEAENNKNLSTLQSMDFYDGKFALTQKGGKWGWINKNGAPVIAFNYEHATQFDANGFATVSKSVENHSSKGDSSDRITQAFLIDTTGTEYRLANSLDELTDETIALDLRGKSLTSDKLNSKIWEQNQLKILLLGGNQLVTLPPELYQLTNLERLYLNQNKIDSLGPGIDSLKNLKTLVLSGNRITKLPAGLKNLAKMEEVVLDNNEIDDFASVLENISPQNPLMKLQLQNNPDTTLPNSIARFSKLRVLTLQNLKLKSLPDSLSGLKELRHLDLENNNLKLFEPINEFKHLVYLDLSSNQLSEFKIDFKELSDLKVLKLNENKLTKISSWKFPDPKNRWKVSFSKRQHPLELLDLSNNKIDSIPGKIQGFQSLREFSLSGNPELKSLPNQIGNLKLLSEINLANSNLKTLPASIGELTNLKVLDLTNTQISSLPLTIGKLSSLQTLSITGGNNLKEIPASIGTLNNLTHLTLDTLGLNSLPASFWNLKTLTVLSLNKNKLVRLPEFPSDTNPQPYKLKELGLHGNSLDKLPDSLHKLVNLETIKASSNRLLGLPPSIGGLSELKILELDSNQIQSLPREMAKLSSLKDLILSNNSLKSLPDSMENLSSLEILNLHNNKFREFPQQLQRLEKLEILDLGSNKIDTISDFPFSNLTSLKALSIRKNGLSHLPQGLQKLSNLLTLDISYNQLDSITVFPKMETLEKLDMSGNSKVRIQKDLTGFKKLKELQLNYANLSSGQSKIQWPKNLVDLILWTQQSERLHDPENLHEDCKVIWKPYHSSTKVED